MFPFEHVSVFNAAVYQSDFSCGLLVRFFIKDCTKSLSMAVGPQQPHEHCENCRWEVSARTDFKIWPNLFQPFVCRFVSRGVSRTSVVVCLCVSSSRIALKPSQRLLVHGSHISGVKIAAGRFSSLQEARVGLIKWCRSEVLSFSPGAIFTIHTRYSGKLFLKIAGMSGCVKLPFRCFRFLPPGQFKKKKSQYYCCYYY